MEIEQINESFGTKLLNLLNTVSDSQYVQCPCKVTAVNGNYVDVLPIVNDDEENQELYDVKIRHFESSSSYIFLKVHVGDRGVLRFFDRSIENYSINGSEKYNEDDRIHDANDGCFELGFIPDNEAYVYPTDKEIEIGLKNVKFKLSIDNDGNVNILSEGNVNINVTGNVNSTINGNSTTTVLNTCSLTAPIINSNGVFTHTGNFNVIGEITSTSEITGTNNDGDLIKLTKHKHTDSMGGLTTKPLKAE